VVFNVLTGAIGSLIASLIERYLQSRQGKKSLPPVEKTESKPSQE